MDKSEKIQTILDLIGIPPHDRARVSKNYEKMPEIQIDARLAKLQQGAAVVAEWRKTRGPPGSAAKPFSGPS